MKLSTICEFSICMMRLSSRERLFFQRQDHWCQIYQNLTEIERFLETQFRNEQQLRADLNAILPPVP